MRKAEIQKQLLEEICLLKDRKGFLKGGFPLYNHLFGRDSLVAAWQLLDWNPGIAKATLEILAKHQGQVPNDEKEEEPGKVLHEMDLGKSRHQEFQTAFPYYGSVDSTPLFLVVFALYIKKTKDVKFLKSHWENILRALNWLEEYGDKDGDYFLEYQRKNPKGLFHQGWKDSSEDHLKIKQPVAIIEAQGYQYMALKEMSVLGASESFAARAENLKKEFNERFWSEDKKYFALALDGKKKRSESITSNPGQCLFTGIMDSVKAKATVKRLFQKDLWTAYGIRTLSMNDPDFDYRGYHHGSIWPHDNWIIAQGLKKLGFKEEYEEIKKAMFSAFDEMGFIPECFGVEGGKIVQVPRANRLQAWAACSLFNFLLS